MWREPQRPYRVGHRRLLRLRLGVRRRTSGAAPATTTRRATCATGRTRAIDERDDRQRRRRTNMPCVRRRARASPRITGNVCVPSARVPRDLVDVLAHQHGRAQQRVRQRREHDGAGDRAGRRVVRAADHQRSPHDEDGRLAEAALLQPQRRRGVRGREQEAAERERDDRPAARDGEHDHDREADRVDHERARRETLAGDRRPTAPGAASRGCAGSPRGRCRPRGRRGRS